MRVAKGLNFSIWIQFLMHILSRSHRRSFAHSLSFSPPQLCTTPLCLILFSSPGTQLTRTVPPSPAPV